MTSYSLNPNLIIVNGPADLMVNITELYTEPIDLDGRRSDFFGAVNILQKDPLVAIRGTGNSIFNGTIIQFVPVRNILNVPITVTGLREGLTGELEIKTGSIHLEAVNREAVDRFQAPPDFLKVDCSGILEPGNYILRVYADSQVETMDGISLRVAPEEVGIMIKAAGEKP